MTDVISSIGPGGDYSLLQLWEDAKPANMVSTATRWIGRPLIGSSFSHSSTILTIGGSTTDSNFYTWLQADSAGFAANGAVNSSPYRYNQSAGVYISAGDNYGEGVVVAESFARISGMQIKGNGTRAALQSLATSCTYEGCIFQGPLPLVSTNSGLKLSNCLFIKTASGGAIAALQSQFDLYNCGFVVPSDVGTVPNGIVTSYINGSSTVTNTYVFGATSNVLSNANVTYSNCASNDVSPITGFTNVAFSTSTFENLTTSNLDLRPKSGSALLNLGVTSVQSPNDVKGTARTVSGSCGIGPWELVASLGFSGSLTGGAVIKSLLGGLVQ